MAWRNEILLIDHDFAKSHLEKCFVEDFFWRPFPKTSIFFDAHNRMGDLIYEVLKGNTHYLENIIEELFRGLENGVTILWMQRINLLLCLSLCFGREKTLQLIKKLENSASEEFIKINLLNSEVVAGLNCVDIEDVTPTPIPQNYIEREAFDGSILFLPDGYSFNKI